MVKALRSVGHDVVAVAESHRSLVDQDVLKLAVNDQRILLTEDKDFGWLVFAAHAESQGVILLRFPSEFRDSLGEEIVRVVREHGSKLTGAFVVVRPGSVRISPKLQKL